MRDNSLGIYCKKDKTFYYLESGSVYVANTVDRVKKTLIARGLIEFVPGSYTTHQDYKVMTCRDANLESMNMSPIYISKNIRKHVLSEETKNNDPDSSGWKK